MRTWNTLDESGVDVTINFAAIGTNGRNSSELRIGRKIATLHIRLQSHVVVAL